MSVPEHDDAEDDFPLIYDIIRKKLANGEPIKLFQLDLPTWASTRYVIKLEAKWNAFSAKTRPVLHWLTVKKDGSSSKHHTGFEPDALRFWKLTKKDGEWEIFIP